MGQAGVILTTLIVYKLILIGVGLWAQRRTHDELDFFLGGRSLGPVVAAISYSASSSSAWTLLGVSGAAFVMGLAALWLVIGAVIGMLIAWIFFAPKLMALSHEHRLVTMTDLLVLGIEGRWRRIIAVTSAVITLIAFTFYVASQFQGAGTTFHQTFDMPMSSSIVIGAAIILVYTLLGGFWAVSVTDTVQGLLMALAAVLLPGAALVAVGGIDGFVHGLRAVSTEAQLSLNGANSGLAAIGFVLGIAGVSLGTFGQPHLMARFMALRDARALRQARVITLIWFLVVFGGMTIVGLAGHILMPDLGNPEYVFFALTRELFPTVIAGVLVAAVLSAIMSTADSQLLVGASAVAHDCGLNRRYGGQHLLISRIAITALVIAAVVVSVSLPATVFERALLAWNGLGSAFGPALIFRIAGIRVRPGGLFLAIVGGFTLVLLFHFDPAGITRTLLPEQWPGTVFERVMSFVFGLVCLALSRTRAAPGKPPAPRSMPTH